MRSQDILDHFRSLFPRGRELKNLRKAAVAAYVNGEYNSASLLWEQVRVRWPNDVVAHCATAACARQLGQLDQSELMAAEAMRLFPDDDRPIAESAQTTQLKGDWAGSVVLWETIIGRSKHRAAWLHMYTHALLICGHYDKLQYVLKEYRAVYPDYPGLFAVEAMLAGAREDWAAALELWRAFRHRFPHEQVGWEHYGRAYQEFEFSQLSSQGRSERVDIMDRAEVDIVEHEQNRQLFLRFEGLGSDCEFGLVQRRFGAEPLSLLRFNSVSFGGLMTGLANRFAGMGSAEATEMITLPNGEYFIRDNRWGLGMHTFNFVGQVDADTLFKKFCQRVEFLKDKLLLDLAESRKIFVFYAPGLALEDLSMLHGALREFGPTTLLHVTTVEYAKGVTSPPSAGDIRELEPGLYVGYLGRMGRDMSGHWNIAFDDWIEVCRRVRSAVDGA